MSPTISNRLDQNTPLQNVINLATSWMNVYSMIAVVLFIVISFAITQQLEVVNDKLEELCASRQDQFVLVKIRRLSSAHAQLGLCVDLTNKS